MISAANPIHGCVGCGKPLREQEEIQLPEWLFGPGRYASYARCYCGAITCSVDGGTHRAVSMPSWR